MAIGAPDANGIWIYGEDDSEATFSALLNKLGNSASSALTTKLNALSGKVVNIVSGTATAEVANSTGTLIDTGLTATITPQSATNKLIVFGNQGFRKDGAGAGTSLYDAYLLRNGSSVKQMARFGLYADGSFGREINAFSHTQTAGTTSALTFKTVFNRSSVSGTVYANIDNLVTSSIIIIEVSQ